MLQTLDILSRSAAYDLSFSKYALDIGKWPTCVQASLTRDGPDCSGMISVMKSGEWSARKRCKIRIASKAVVKCMQCEGIVHNCRRTKRKSDFLLALRLFARVGLLISCLGIIARQEKQR